MKDLNFNSDWYTHLPIIEYFINNHEISFVLEHGTGVFSTQRLNSDNWNYMGFEESEEFYTKMQEDESYKKRVCFFNLPSGINIGTRPCELDHDQVHAISSDLFKIKNILLSRGLEFNRYEQRNKNINILFVDGYTCSRTMWINTLYGFFDVIIFHDTEPNSWYDYGYEKISDNIYKNYDSYKVTSNTSWTSFLVNKNLSIDKYLLGETIRLFSLAENMDYIELVNG